MPRLWDARLHQCQAVPRWLDQPDDAKKRITLEALQISVVATREQATVSGVLPLDLPTFLSCRVHRHASWLLQNQN